MVNVNTGIDDFKWIFVEVGTIVFIGIAGYFAVVEVFICAAIPTVIVQAQLLSVDVLPLISTTFGDLGVQVSSVARNVNPPR